MRRLIQVSSCLTLLFSLVAFQFAPLVTVTQAQKQEKTDSAKFKRPGGKHKTLDPAGITRLKNNTGGRAKVSVSDATGGARFVRLAPGERGSLSSADKSVSPNEKSATFLKEYGSIFGLTNPDAELRVEQEVGDRQGGKHLKYGQVYNGVPVFAGTVITHFDADSNLSAANGNIVPEISVNPNPSRTSQEAAAAALALVSQDTGAGGLSVNNTKLYIYRTGLAQGVDGENYLAWEIEVGNGADVREFVYVDAHTGKVVDQMTGIIDAMYRRAYDGLFLPAPPPSYPAAPYWVEGNAFPTASAEANNMITSSKETYDLYFNSFGRDSFDNAGTKMDAIFNRGYSCPNASWNGTFISFCNGMTSDDVTGHEWTHAYTQYTHGLIYAWQPGALNESYSDIFGETIDRINGRDNVGNSLTDPARSGDACSTSGGTPPPTLTITGGPSAGSYQARASVNEPPRPFTVGPTAMSLTVPAGACTPLTNAANVAGKIAVIDWTLNGSGGNECASGTRANNAKNAGAAGIIFIAPSTGILNIGSVATIASVEVTYADGQTIKAGLPASATISLGVGTFNSTRWLMGEDDTAAGLSGPLRDMWNPRCFGNPGKVSDQFEYVCSTADNGGVHTNSGIPNHAYALIVDGGTYNGQTINGLGLTKAAHIYFRAMSVYQHSSSNFADHADAIEQSAADLIGSNLADLSTGLPSGQSITAADVAEIEKAMLAVEMRNPPTFCNFQKLLGQTPPADPACGTGSASHTVFADDFEGSTAGWTLNNVPVGVGYNEPDWTVSSTLPDGRAGKAFFAEDPNIGGCNATDNESGVRSLTSPVIAIPAGMSSSTLTFMQWVATEATFDGGQLLISVNGGPFTLVPQANYIYNGYNSTFASVGAGNTNPRAGQRAWSGTDGGAVDGSWGRTIVNLSSLVAPGNNIQLRWDMSTDGCGGTTFGWYVDDVRVYDCEADGDGDGVPDAYDNCPTTSNANQANNDGDAQGDVCDADDDNDGVLDVNDNCQFTANPGQEDFDLDGTGDACDSTTGPVSNKDQCKNNGWMRFDTPRTFNNQGDCIQFFNTGK